jgi:hypothetical protein
MNCRVLVFTLRRIMAIGPWDYLANLDLIKVGQPDAIRLFPASARLSAVISRLTISWTGYELNDSGTLS